MSPSSEKGGKKAKVRRRKKPIRQRKDVDKQARQKLNGMAAFTNRKSPFLEFQPWAFLKKKTSEKRYKDRGGNGSTLPGRKAITGGRSANMEKVIQVLSAVPVSTRHESIKKKEH